MIIFFLMSLFEGEFLNLGMDAGSWGRGCTGLVYPITNYENPASVLLLHPQVSLTGSKLFNDMANILSGGINIRKDNTGYGISFILHSVGDIHNTENALIDINGNGIIDEGEELDESKITYFSSREGVLNATYARLFHGFTAGVNLKFIYKRIASEVAYGAGTDIGIIYNREFYSFGLMIRDLTTSPIFWEGRTEHISPAFMFGAGIKRMIGSIETLMEVNLIQDDYGFNHRLGIELGFNRYLIGRLGFINNQMTAGIGLEKLPVKIDYAINIHRRLPISHRISILYRFE